MADPLDELLTEATAALRERGDGDAPVDATRQRLMASYRPRSQARRAGAIVFGLALSSGTLAWAASTGRIDAALEGLGVKDRARPAAAQSEKASSRRGEPATPTTPATTMTPATTVMPATVTTVMPATTLMPAEAPNGVPTATRETAPRIATPTSTPTAVVSAPVAASTAPAQVATARPGRRTQRVAVASAVGPSVPSAAVDSAPVPSPPPAIAPSVEDADLTAYRHAHALHFHGGAPTATLAAWDDYLAAFPDGRFAVEARYDRALVLVRLGRVVDAQAALAPFAAGSVAGGYRQPEATALLTALRRQP